MTGIVCLIAWIIFSYVFAAVAPTVFAGILYGIEWLCICIWTALGIVLRAAARGLPILIGLLYRAVCDAALFIWFLFAEWRHGPEEDFTQDEAGPDAAADETDRYEQARALFGLEPGFTREALSRAYRRLMARIHPDLPGGSLRAAQEANSARDLLMRAHGWA